MKKILQVRTNLKAGRREDVCPKWDLGTWGCVAQDTKWNNHPEVYTACPDGDWPQNCWKALKKGGYDTKGWVCVDQGC